MYEIVDLQQGSADWLRWRHDGIGASDAAALMGQNPWRSPGALFAEKVAPPRYGAQRRQRPLPAVADLFGTAPVREDNGLEAQARRLYRQRHGSDVVPVCLASTDRPWQRASLDGADLATGRLLEIKCGAATYAAVAQSGRVPAHYIGQLQQTLAVTGLETIDFWVWLPGRPPLLITERRDDVYIAELNRRGAAFWQRVQQARQTSCASRP
ncbi:lambda-exonuclease family protein [Polymorphobacter fuscus]|nr:YqaJ viral recombinase family protein [Polymorphobacter fuscus]NJC07591.1 putative phage-type endonuclease [Polymorphobacter fuscus]